MLCLKDISVICTGFYCSAVCFGGLGVRQLSAKVAWLGSLKGSHMWHSSSNHSIQTSGWKLQLIHVGRGKAPFPLFCPCGQEKTETGKGMKNATEAEDFFLLLSILPGNLLAFLGFECLSWAAEGIPWEICRAALTGTGFPKALTFSSVVIYICHVQNGSISQPLLGRSGERDSLILGIYSPGVKSQRVKFQFHWFNMELVSLL